jgi:hypothetical protein
MRERENKIDDGMAKTNEYVNVWAMNKIEKNVFEYCCEAIR